jgi:hypothetical protein
MVDVDINARAQFVADSKVWVPWEGYHTTYKQVGGKGGNQNDYLEKARQFIHAMGLPGTITVSDAGDFARFLGFEPQKEQIKALMSLLKAAQETPELRQAVASSDPSKRPSFIGPKRTPVYKPETRRIVAPGQGHIANQNLLNRDEKTVKTTDKYGKVEYISQLESFLRKYPEFRVLQLPIDEEALAEKDAQLPEKNQPWSVKIGRGEQIRPRKILLKGGGHKVFPNRLEGQWQTFPQFERATDDNEYGLTTMAQENYRNTKATPSFLQEEEESDKDYRKRLKEWRTKWKTRAIGLMRDYVNLRGKRLAWTKYSDKQMAVRESAQRAYDEGLKALDERLERFYLNNQTEGRKVNRETWDKGQAEYIKEEAKLQVTLQKELDAATHDIDETFGAFAGTMGWIHTGLGKESGDFLKTAKDYMNWLAEALQDEFGMYWHEMPELATVQEKLTTVLKHRAERQKAQQRIESGMLTKAGTTTEVITDSQGNTFEKEVADPSAPRVPITDLGSVISILGRKAPKLAQTEEALTQETRPLRVITPSTHSQQVTEANEKKIWEIMDYIYRAHFLKGALSDPIKPMGPLVHPAITADNHSNVATVDWTENFEQIRTAVTKIRDRKIKTAKKLLQKVKQGRVLENGVRLSADPKNVKKVELYIEELGKEDLDFTAYEIHSRVRALARDSLGMSQNRTRRESGDSGGETYQNPRTFPPVRDFEDVIIEGEVVEGAEAYNYSNDVAWNGQVLNTVNRMMGEEIMRYKNEVRETSFTDAGFKPDFTLQGQENAKENTDENSESFLEGLLENNAEDVRAQLSKDDFVKFVEVFYDTTMDSVRKSKGYRFSDAFIKSMKQNVSSNAKVNKAVRFSKL